jgi:hypothetical protein
MGLTTTLHRDFSYTGQNGASTKGVFSVDASSFTSIALNPVFIVGAPRSGTSWVQRLLLSDPAVCGGQETHFFSVFGLVIDSFHAHQKLGRNVGLPSYWTEAALQDEIRSLWERTVLPVIRGHSNPRVLVEKTPDHAIALPAILRLIPNAKVIHVVRDSRAVVASMLAASRGWGSGWAPSTAAAASIMWFRYNRAALAASTRMSHGQYLRVRYEDLLLDGLAQVHRLFDFIGIEKSEQNLAELVLKNQFAAQGNLGSPIPVVIGEPTEPEGFFRKGKIDSWRDDLSFGQKLVVWRYTRRLMRELGYSWRVESQVFLASSDDAGIE